MSDPTVYIVDDDPDVRDSLRWLLKTVGLRCVTYLSALDFLRAFNEDGPACLVLDVRMPGCSGLDLLEEMNARGWRLPVLFITAYADVPMAVRAMKSGAVEFLEKPFNGQVLLENIQKAVNADVDRRARESGLGEARAKLETLTGKDREVLEMIRDGRPNKEIAARLEVTARAVELETREPHEEAGRQLIARADAARYRPRHRPGRPSQLALNSIKAANDDALNSGIHARISDTPPCA